MLKQSFNRQSDFRVYDSIWFWFWALLIDDDRQELKKEHRKRIEAQKKRFHQAELQPLRRHRSPVP